MRQVIDKAVLIHSVDTVELAEQIEKDAAKRDLTVDILLEVNVAEEESKFGFPDRGSGGCCDENKRVSSRSHKRPYDNCSICIEFGR